VSDMLSTTADSSDAELISAVRAGDTESYGQLFGRHRDAANRLARQLVPGPDADDLVAEASIRVLVVLQAGKGPDESFRAYLLTSIRRLHIDRIRASKRVRSTDDESELDRAVEFVDPATMRFEKSAAAAAFSSLPERWQLVLWHLDVEGQKPADIAPLLGMSANSVSALAYRAREGLRQAYLQGHLAPTLHEGCRKTTLLLGSYVRKGLSARDTAQVETHLDGCSRCTGLYLELAEVNSNLSGILGPALLGTAAAGYLAGSGAAAAGAGAALGLKGVVAHAARAAFEPVKAVAAGAGTQGVVAVTVVAGLATAGTIAVAATSHHDSVSQKAPISTTAPSVTPSPGTPTPSASTPTSTPTPAPTVTPTPTPTPAVVPLAPVPTETTPTESPTEPAPTDPPTTTAPVIPPPAPTDYGITAVNITNDDALLQRRYTIPISVTTDGRAVAHTVTMQIAFRHSVVFRGVVSPGWNCGTATRNQRLSTLTCTTSLPAGESTTFIAKARSLFQRGVVTVSAAGDPQPANNSRPFSAGLWLPL
jgi:RNA polymerase sigma factor (sigma-70 family)